MKFLLTTALLTIVGFANARLGEVVDERSLQVGDDSVDVLVGYKSGLARRNIQSRTNGIYSQFSRLNTLAARIPRSQLLELADDPDVDFVEEDYRLYRNGETVPYGIELSQGLSDVIPRSFESTACNDPNSFKIGIIDSGLSITHPDTPCGPSGNPTNCKGISFGLPTGVEWYNPTDIHGTHIAGTIGAMGKNNLGVAGMLQDNDVCYLIARVFGDNDKSTSTSSVVAAVEWLEDQGAKVINMSLGGSSRSQLLGNAIAEASANGVLVIASSGNDGPTVTALNYPASFPDVISVAAVDSAYHIADFSQSNSEVDISAPGVDILSTVPLGSGSVGNLDLGDFAVSGKYLLYSVVPETEGITGTLVECPDLGRSTCPGPGSHICLVKRGEISFEEKAKNCEDGGGAAIIVYNHSPGLIAGRLADDTLITIPVLGVPQADGETLKASYLGVSAKAGSIDGYGYLDGTSMAAPHVVGAAALIWRACNSCTNTQVAQCLEDTAMDLGTTGWDKQFGHGLVQTENAYLCLINDIGCCSAAETRTTDEDTSNPSSTTTTTTPTGAPTTPPTMSPSTSFTQTSKQFAPSGKPTNTPTVAPTTDAPSAAPTTSQPPSKQSLPTDKPTNSPTVLVTTAPSSQPSIVVESIKDQSCAPMGEKCIFDSDCCQWSRCYGMNSRRTCLSFLFSFPLPP